MVCDRSARGELSNGGPGTFLRLLDTELCEENWFLVTELAILNNADIVTFADPLWPNEPTEPTHVGVFRVQEDVLYTIGA